jgi:hypothetical protein
VVLVLAGVLRPVCTQGNVFTFLQQSGGRLPESVVVPMILEPTMSALNYIHELVRGAVATAAKACSVDLPAVPALSPA